MKSSNKRRVLVLGGTGKAGSAVVCELLALNYNVFWTYSKGIPKLAEDVGNPVAFCATDISSALRWTESFLTCNYAPELVVNCLSTDKYNDTNLLFLIHGVIPNLLSQFNVPVIHISSNAVFNAKENKRWTAKDTPTNNNTYGRAKRFGECSNQTVIRTSFVGDSVWASDHCAYITTLLQKRLCRWNGITTVMLARLVSLLVKAWFNYELWEPRTLHLCSRPENWQDVAEWVSTAYNCKVLTRTNLKSPSLLLSGFELQTPLEEQIKELQNPVWGDLGWLSKPLFRNNLRLL